MERHGLMNDSHFIGDWCVWMQNQDAFPHLGMYEKETTTLVRWNLLAEEVMTLLDTNAETKCRRERYIC